MHPHGITGLLIQVIKSWQVIFITLALIFYFALVFYVARTHHTPRRSGAGLTAKPAKAKKEKPSEVIPQASDDDLGVIEEE
ncbi:MAG: hypothetical protein LBG84_03910 [Treponema sp.]|jgi:hypothetical protein|nr:hypothetical protein [Treponema sp.]